MCGGSWGVGGPVRRQVRYSVHPSVEYGRRVLENLPVKTGRSLDEWIDLLGADGPGGETERRNWLREEHALGGTTARMIAERSVGKGLDNSDPKGYLRAAEDYIEGMYGGGRAALRPLHDALLELSVSLGQVCPCETIVPLYQKHVFAEIKPATSSRIDFGLARKGTSKRPPKRLLETGGLAKGDRITHRFALRHLHQVDGTVERWLAVAYDLDD